MIFPIFIPSKGRPECPTANLLRAELVPFTLVVEPQDLEKYQEVWSGEVAIVLPENDKGISYVRNFILNYARENNLSWFWMIDDDITGFYKVEGKKCVPCIPDEALIESQRVFSNSKNIAIASLEYQQYAWNSACKPRFNSYNDVCVCINTELTKKFSYRPNTKEDRDFTLQCLTNGLNTLRITKYAFSCPKIGSNKGGLHQEYANHQGKTWVTTMLEQWKGITKPIIKPDGSTDVKINWRLFRRT